MAASTPRLSDEFKETGGLAVCVSRPGRPVIGGLPGTSAGQTAVSTAPFGSIGTGDTCKKKDPDPDPDPDPKAVKNMPTPGTRSDAAGIE